MLAPPVDPAGGPATAQLEASSKEAGDTELEAGLVVSAATMQVKEEEEEEAVMADDEGTRRELARPPRIDPALRCHETLVQNLCLDAKTDTTLDWNKNVCYQVCSYVADMGLHNMKHYKYAGPVVGIATNIKQYAMVGLQPQAVVRVSEKGALTTHSEYTAQANILYELWRDRVRKKCRGILDSSAAVQLPAGEYVLGTMYSMPHTETCLNCTLPLQNLPDYLPVGAYKFLQVLLLAAAGNQVKHISPTDVDTIVHRWQEERTCVSQLEHRQAATFAHHWQY
ncbi:hypothetical protein WJX72_004847 [[Myrmecia] bisecta]|uniref:Uncharacterized protein n=1 Tax=[Myrmecia] bisecta TaxID=41462 RepID=A0AAW1QQI4_9CHLO